jgi:citrate/tricarballylate utilization protein
MAALLASHLSAVLALFLVLAYGKFVHGFYRFAALLRFATDTRQAPSGGKKGPETSSRD